ncbi:hypothetical protein AB205_0031010 [Aquarana catesbeiana]|uniref:MPN domain-containing protein n=1 Tax=Aquarana catesbeiana TaxID=8400 RepID=A0A2G9SK45_AQUCT|nr:hypothetical protein AB205_0031010 [Aquarana catesbeiana]
MAETLVDIAGQRWGSVQYQMEMMRSLRHVNIDHLHVGWYQSTYYGTFVSRALLDSQFSYQHAIEESVVLIYDPIKTAQGSLSLKAYRLTPKLMEVCKEKDFSVEGYREFLLNLHSLGDIHCIHMCRRHRHMHTEETAHTYHFFSCCAVTVGSRTHALE